MKEDEIVKFLIVGAGYGEGLKKFKFRWQHEKIRKKTTAWYECTKLAFSFVLIVLLQNRV